MIDRRAFIQRSAIVLAGGALSPALRRSSGHDRVLRVGTLIAARDRDLDVGLSFGAGEASRSASLFGWRVERALLDRADGSTSLHALVLGTRADIAHFDGPVLALRCDVGGRASFVLPPCERQSGGGTQVVLWHESLERFGAEQLNDRFRAATGQPMSSDGWLGWFAMKALAEAALRSRSVAPGALIDYLARAQFDGHKGLPLTFDARRRLRQPLYELERAAGAWRVGREIDPATGSP